MSTIGSRIGAARRAAGLTLEEVGAKVGVTKQSVSYWEADETSPRADLLAELAKVLGVSVGHLFGERAK
jgi:transcriptional regulator with XRE-family HTH domain